jgi:S1-C subfamily serine protease
MKTLLYLIPVLGVIIYAWSNSTTPPPTIAAPLPSTLYDKYKNSVVMVLNEYYYTIQTDNGMTYYYSPDSGLLFYVTFDEVEDNISGGTGTGFYISNNGNLITNRHVVMPEPDNFIKDYNRFKSFLNYNFSYNLSLINDSLKTIQDIVNQIDTLNNVVPIVLPPDIILTMQTKLSPEFSNPQLLFNTSKGTINNLLKEKYNRLESQKFQYLEIINKFKDLMDSDPEYLVPKYVNHNLAIVLNEAKDRPDEIKECRIMKVSQDPKVDLALIKTINQSDNTLGLTVFDFAEHNPNITTTSNIKSDLINPLSIHDEVFMIGFNRGLEIGLTTKGLQSQLTDGKISQNPGKNRIMYTIPTLPGSSGSPVIDKWGNLVAIHYASTSGKQSFNFGIPVYKLYEFLNAQLTN